MPRVFIRFTVHVCFRVQESNNHVKTSDLRIFRDERSSATSTWFSSYFFPPTPGVLLRFHPSSFIIENKSTRCFSADGFKKLGIVWSWFYCQELIECLFQALNFIYLEDIHTVSKGKDARNMIFSSSPRLPCVNRRRVWTYYLRLGVPLADSDDVTVHCLLIFRPCPAH